MTITNPENAIQSYQKTLRSRHDNQISKPPDTEYKASKADDCFRPER